MTVPAATPVSRNLAEIHQRIAAAAKRAGRKPVDINLVTVGKNQPPEALQAAYAAGERRFGESRVQALVGRGSEGLTADIEWHLIGPLQSNKVRIAVKHAAILHGIDSVPLIERVSWISAMECAWPGIFLQVNISGEASKNGVAPAELPALVESAAAAAGSGNLRLLGLMTMAPYDAPQDDLRRVFAGLRQLAEKTAISTGIPLPHLSMGMSDDYEIAIEEGATFVRVGSAIFA